MDSLQRALYEMLTTMLAEERWPDGRPLDPRRWWYVLGVAETVADGPVPQWTNRAHPDDRRPALFPPAASVRLP